MKMNDSYVSKCSPESALGQNAYMLFYEKIHEEPAPVMTEPEPVKVTVNGNGKKVEKETVSAPINKQENGHKVEKKAEKPQTIAK